MQNSGNIAGCPCLTFWIGWKEAVFFLYCFRSIKNVKDDVDAVFDHDDDKWRCWLFHKCWKAFLIIYVSVAWSRTTNWLGHLTILMLVSGWYHYSHHQLLAKKCLIICDWSWETRFASWITDFILYTSSLAHRVVWTVHHLNPWHNSQDEWWEALSICANVKQTWMLYLQKIIQDTKKAHHTHENSHWWEAT